MTKRPKNLVTFSEVFDLPLTVDMETTARVFGICTNTAYKLAKKNKFPCPVMRMGRKYRISTAQLLHALGIEERPVYAEDVEAYSGIPNDSE